MFRRDKRRGAIVDPDGIYTKMLTAMAALNVNRTEETKADNKSPASGKHKRKIDQSGAADEKATLLPAKRNKLDAQACNFVSLWGQSSDRRTDSPADNPSKPVPMAIDDDSPITNTA